MTDGRAPVEAHVFYDRAVECSRRSLGDITSAGVVFPVDLRLRPGSKGSGFATSLDAVAQYYREWADPWERQTLTRARLVGGDPRLGRVVRQAAPRARLRPERARRPTSRRCGRCASAWRRSWARRIPGGCTSSSGAAASSTWSSSPRRSRCCTARGDPRSDARTRSWRSPPSARPGSCPPDDGEALAEHYRFLRRVSAGLRLFGARPADTLEPAGPIPGRLAKSLDYPVAQGVPRGLPAAHRVGARALRSRGAAVSERLFVLDGPGYLYRAYHALPYLSTSKGVPCHAVYGMSTMLWKLLREESPEYFAVAWDPPGPDVSRGALRRLQGAAAGHARRPPARRSPTSRRCSRRSACRSSRCRASRPTTSSARWWTQTRDLPARGRARDGGQGHAPARRPEGARARRRVARTGERVVYDEAAVKEKWGVAPTQIPDLLALMGDSHRQYPGRARRRREDGGQAHRPVRQRRAPVREPPARRRQAPRDARAAPANRRSSRASSPR